MKQAIKPWPTNATSRFNIVQHCSMQHVELVWPPCCIVWYGVETILISIKCFIQHRSTFLLFACVTNKVALVWPRTSTLLHSRKSSLNQEQRVDCTKIRDHYSSQISNLHNSSLHTQHVAFVWPRSLTPSNKVEFNNVEWCCIHLARAGSAADWYSEGASSNPARVNIFD